MPPTWITAFLDFAPDGFDDGVRFWSALTEYDVSSRRGDADEFATLVPGDGAAFLRVQRLETGADRIHLDLHVEAPRAAADDAIDLGATEVADHGYVVLRSPGGFTFCFVPHRASTRPGPTAWPDGHSSLLDQVCLDIPASSYERESEFWRDLTGWEERASSVSTEFHSLLRPEGHPLRLLLQRLGEQTGDVRAHLDWATTDRSAETARHVGRGAAVVAVHEGWTVLADPNGRVYCITDRKPATGLPG
ncbi:VOC family protein [Nocardioides bizhenqiangii]|uniref:VOC family protein n=1 Tax=Nocardioides bizhenqiangii TaxID=3095076 RepID=A0ABZ0ZT90_9ACTN|nr:MULTISPECIES: VOC family protein [unclassified Nocardioides]MDZ5621791.1 VOC family protein [Nocardioides sp. HM23]WQQ27523.1 VOC family protein [Nocardioides sp. HM61]